MSLPLAGTPARGDAIRPVAMWVGALRRGARYPPAMSRLTTITVGLGLALFACGPAADPDAEAPAAPGQAAVESRAQARVVLITIDTLRKDAVAKAMPLLHRRMADGLRFEAVYSSSPSTQPSHASKLTGLHPWQHGVTRNGQVLSEEHVTVAELARDAGFATSAVVASYPLDPRFGQAQGFDKVVAEFTESRRVKVRTWKGHKPDWDAFFCLADTVTGHALATIDELADEPRQMLWFHYYDPHSPYGDTAGVEHPLETKVLTALAQMDQPAQLEDAVRRCLKRYHADCAALDKSLDRVLTRLLDQDDGVPTHVILTADHGESFGHDGSFGHGDRVTADQMWVPTVVFSSDAEPGERHDVGGSVDIFATVLARAGLAPPPGTSGRDLLGPAPRDGGAAFGMRRSFAGKASDVRSDGTIIPLSGYRFFAVRDGTYWYGDEDGVDVYAGGPVEEGAAARVSSAFGAFTRTLEGLSVEEDLSDEAQAALEALGYTR